MTGALVCQILGFLVAYEFVRYLLVFLWRKKNKKRLKYTTEQLANLYGEIRLLNETILRKVEHLLYGEDLGYPTHKITIEEKVNQQLVILNALIENSSKTNEFIVCLSEIMSTTYVDVGLIKNIALEILKDKKVSGDAN